MIVVVEGIDRVGKTRFCKKLSKDTGIPVFKEGMNFKEMSKIYGGETIRRIMCEKMKSILNVLKITGQDMIFDRFHISEWVYGYLERKAFYCKDIKEIDEMLYDMGAIVVILHPSGKERLKHCSREHGKDLSGYERMFKRVGAESKCLNYETVASGSNALIKYIMENTKLKERLNNGI